MTYPLHDLIFRGTLAAFPALNLMVLRCCRGFPVGSIIRRTRGRNHLRICRYR
jgi:hypothetical protein